MAKRLPRALAAYLLGQSGACGQAREVAALSAPADLRTIWQ